METNHKQAVIERVSVIALICAAMVGIHVVDLLLGGWFKSFGIQPRNVGSAYTVVIAPWLHSDFSHLGTNLSAFIVLAALCLLNGVRYFAKASLLIILVGGALVWLFGRSANHIGASGWIFGLWSLAIATAWYDRSYRNIVIALGVLFLYGGLIWGVFPTQIGISFESHLFGAIAGVIAASTLSRRPQQTVAAPVQRVAELQFWPDKQK